MPSLDKVIGYGTTHFPYADDADMEVTGQDARGEHGGRRMKKRREGGVKGVDGRVRR